MYPLFFLLNLIGAVNLPLSLFFLRALFTGCAAERDLVWGFLILSLSVTVFLVPILKPANLINGKEH